MATDNQVEAEPESQEPGGLTERESQPAHWFRPGDPRASEAGKLGGRPRKGQSTPELLRKELDRRAPKIIDGLLTKAEKGDTRAFVAAMAHSYGVPAQKLVVEQADSPASDLLLAMLAAKGLAIPPIRPQVLNDRIVPELPMSTPPPIDATDT
jgi:hypothetical protein